MEIERSPGWITTVLFRRKAERGIPFPPALLWASRTEKIAWKDRIHYWRYRRDEYPCNLSNGETKTSHTFLLGTPLFFIKVDHNNMMVGGLNHYLWLNGFSFR